MIRNKTNDATEWNVLEYELQLKAILQLKFNCWSKKVFSIRPANFTFSLLNNCVAQMMWWSNSFIH